MATTRERERTVDGPDGSPHRFTFAEFVRLGELGMLPTRSELVDGEVFEMSPKGDVHYFAAFALQRQFILADHGRYVAGPEPTLRLDDSNAPMPDILVTPQGVRVSPAAAELVIEIADSSLNYDRGAKRRRYAEANIREYWVLDVNGEVLERYLPAGAAKPMLFRAGDALAPSAYPDVAIDLAKVFEQARTGRRQTDD